MANLKSMIDLKKPERDTHGQSTFSHVKWVCLAVSNDKLRGNLQYVLLDDGYFIASDSHRIHIYKSNYGKEFDGLYEISLFTGKRLILEKIEGTDFPDWRRTQNKMKDFTQSLTLTGVKRGAEKGIVSLNTASALILKALDYRSGINLHYLDDVLSSGHEYTVTIPAPDSNKIVLECTEEDEWAALMPFKLVPSDTEQLAKAFEKSEVEA